MKRYALVVGCAVVGGLLAHAMDGWATGGEQCLCQNPPATSCANPVKTYLDSCGNPTCTTPSFLTACQPLIDPSTVGCNLPVAGTNNCGACTVNGTKNCGGSGQTDSPYKPYGYAVPGDETYGFSNVTAFKQSHAAPEKASLLGLAAKGNIVIGNYRSAPFENKTLPKLRTGVGSIVQPYVVDPTDEALGYKDSTNVKGELVFSGNYDRRDWQLNAAGQLVPGTKLDGTERKFYESTLPNDVFQALIDPSDPLYSFSRDGQIDAVLYTNHAIAGYVPPKQHDGNGYNYFTMNGSMVSRDDALMIDSNFVLNHDMRLSGQGGANNLGLPLALARPRLTRWRECPPSPAACQ